MKQCDCTSVGHVEDQQMGRLTRLEIPQYRLEKEHSCKGNISLINKVKTVIEKMNFKKYHDTISHIR